ncbi:MAG: 50S ribosomal protein L21 [bacterium]
MATAKKTTKEATKDPVKKAPKAAVKKDDANREFAVIFTGGKQYKVAVGDTLKIEKLDGKFTAGDKIVFDKVLLVDNGVDTTIGSPYITSAKVESIFQKHGRAKTVKVVKYKQKSRYLKRNGHRQPFIEVKISAIK